MPHQLAWTGRPPDERRCKRIRSNGLQCGKWAMVGYDVCRTHGGNARKSNIKKRMHVFYAAVLGDTLTERIKDLIEAPDVMTLREELALMRHAASNTVKLYAVACASGKEEAVLAAGALMADALKQVADMCERAARVESQGDDKISVMHIQVIVNQITRIAHRVLGEEHLALAQEFERLVRTEVRLPKTGVEGTSITPDQDVLEMDETVPEVE